MFLSSHSPIILSDIPSDNVVYMDSGKNITEIAKKEIGGTFAQNIYSLYRQSFFMNAAENNLWIHGDLAKRYIESIENEIRNLDRDDIKSKEKIDQKINVISEPMIKKYYKVILG